LYIFQRNYGKIYEVYTVYFTGSKKSAIEYYDKQIDIKFLLNNLEVLSDLQEHDFYIFSDKSYRCLENIKYNLEQYFYEEPKKSIKSKKMAKTNFSTLLDDNEVPF